MLLTHAWYIVGMIDSFFFNVHLVLRQRETEHEQGRGRERHTHTESKANSRL